MRMLCAGVLLGGLAAGILCAQPGKPDFSGMWLLDTPKGDGQEETAGRALTIRQDAKQIHLQEKANAADAIPNAEFRCGTQGKSCSMLDHGQKAQVSLWYNGGTLVVLKTGGRKGAVVTKRRLSLQPDGQSLEVEVVHIDPQSRTEKLRYTRSQ